MSSHSAAAVVAAAVALAVCSLPAAQAHGWLQQPMARNWYYSGQRWDMVDKTYSGNRFWNPMGLNRASRGVNGAYCGGEFTNDARFDVGGTFATKKIIATYKAGQTFTAKMQIWNNHWGYLQLRLCPLRGIGTTNDEKASLSEACFQKHVLKRSDNNKPWHWIYKDGPGEQFMVTQSFRLPAGVTCKRCVLQWMYVTGHQCLLPGVDKARMAVLQPGGSRDCPSNYLDANTLPSEKFWNCADIRIE